MKNPQRIDLSHTIEEGMITYKGLPAPIICDYLSREASKNMYGADTTFQIGKIEMVANTGTYIDAPFHRFERGKDLAALAVERLVHLEAVRIDAREFGQKGIQKKLFEGRDLKNKAVLIQTDWSQHWRTDQYFENHPFLTANAAHYLKEQGVTLVGIDSHNIDDVQDLKRPAHTILLGADIPIVEHMTNMEAIQQDEFYFSAIPPKIRDFGTFPVRAVAYY